MLKENSCSFIDHIISSQVILGAQTIFAVSFHESLTLTQGYSPCSQLCSWKPRVLPSCFKPWYRLNPGAGDSPSELTLGRKQGGKKGPWELREEISLTRPYQPFTGSALSPSSHTYYVNSVTTWERQGRWAPWQLPRPFWRTSMPTKLINKHRVWSHTFYIDSWHIS